MFKEKKKEEIKRDQLESLNSKLDLVLRKVVYLTVCVHEIDEKILLLFLSGAGLKATEQGITGSNSNQQSNNINPQFLLIPLLSQEETQMISEKC